MEATDKVPKWLKRLQENSWEAELLISGGAIFALLSFSENLIDFVQHLKFSSSFIGMDITTLLFMGAVKGITIGFILHIVLRGLWISLVCLNYSFPQGINFTRLKISGWYESKARQYKLVEQILSLDHLSGLVFFASFAFVFFIIGFLAITASSYVLSGLIASLFGNSIDEADTFFLPLNIIYSLFIIDLISSGWLRTNKWIGRFYFPIYYILNGLSLAFIYRPWFQIIFTNINRWKAFAFCVLFLVVTAAYTNVSLVRLFHWRTFIDQHHYQASAIDGPTLHTFYENRLGGSTIFFACIPSEIATEKYFRLFVPYRSGYDPDIEAANGKYFSDIVDVQFNKDKPLQLEWIGTTHEITNQRGIFAMLPIENLPSGKNTLAISIRSNYFASRMKREIPFWKE